VRIGGGRAVHATDAPDPLSEIGHRSTCLARDPSATKCQTFDEPIVGGKHNCSIWRKQFDFLPAADHSAASCRSGQNTIDERTERQSHPRTKSGWQTQSNFRGCSGFREIATVRNHLRGEKWRKQNRVNRGNVTVSFAVSPFDVQFTVELVHGKWIAYNHPILSKSSDDWTEWDI
jgi:hypothetical protein